MITLLFYVLTAISAAVSVPAGFGAFMLAGQVARFTAAEAAEPLPSEMFSAADGCNPGVANCHCRDYGTCNDNDRFCCDNWCIDGSSLSRCLVPYIVDPRPGQTIVDVGTGNAWLVGYLQPRVYPGGVVIATDLDDFLVEPLNKLGLLAWIGRLPLGDLRGVVVTSETDTGLDGWPDKAIDHVAIIESVNFRIGQDPSVNLTYIKGFVAKMRSGGRLTFFNERLFDDSVGVADTVALFERAGLVREDWRAFLEKRWNGRVKVPDLKGKPFDPLTEGILETFIKP